MPMRRAAIEPYWPVGPGPQDPVEGWPNALGSSPAPRGVYNGNQAGYAPYKEQGELASFMQDGSMSNLFSLDTVSVQVGGTVLNAGSQVRPGTPIRLFCSAGPSWFGLQVKFTIHQGFGPKPTFAKVVVFNLAGNAWVDTIAPPDEGGYLVFASPTTLLGGSSVQTSFSVSKTAPVIDPGPSGGKGNDWAKAIPWVAGAAIAFAAFGTVREFKK